MLLGAIQIRARFIFFHREFPNARENKKRNRIDHETRAKFTISFAWRKITLKSRAPGKSMEHVIPSFRNRSVNISHRDERNVRICWNEEIES